MQENKRQKQVGHLIQQELSDLFQRMGLSVTDGGMITISAVRMTPDLLEARIYLSLYQINEPDKMMEKIKDRTGEIKKQLGTRLGKQLRRIPQLTFYKDDTMDHVFKMEEIFKKIHEEKE
jgi:ribosome-binding factor A